jgi:hypothetical protein
VAWLVAFAGVDGLLALGLRLLLGLVVLALLVALVVAQTVAGVVTGGRPAGRSASEFAVQGSQPISAPPSEPTPVLGSDLGGIVVQLASSWLGVPYVFGGCSRSGVDCSCLECPTSASASGTATDKCTYSREIRSSRAGVHGVLGRAFRRCPPSALTCPRKTEAWSGLSPERLASKCRHRGPSSSPCVGRERVLGASRAVTQACGRWSVSTRMPTALSPRRRSKPAYRVLEDSS